MMDGDVVHCGVMWDCTYMDGRYGGCLAEGYGNEWLGL
jgi:hypothetical protein